MARPQPPLGGGRGRTALPPADRQQVAAATARGQVHDGRRRLPRLYVHLHIAAFEFKLGDIFLHQQFDEFFDFLLIHRIPFGRARGPDSDFDLKPLFARAQR